MVIEPRTGIQRKPVYLWVNQKRVADRFQQNLVAGLEAGRTFGNFMQVSAEWRAEDTRWSLITGTGDPYLTGTAQTGQLHIRIDHASAGTLSPCRMVSRASHTETNPQAADSISPFASYGDAGATTLSPGTWANIECNA